MQQVKHGTQTVNHSIEQDINLLPEVIDIKHPRAHLLEIKDKRGNKIVNIVSYNRVTKQAILRGDKPFFTIKSYSDYLHDNEKLALGNTEVLLEDSTIEYKTKK